LNKELWKQMSLSKKLVWFIQYYGVTTLVVIGSILVLFSLGKTFFGEKEKADIKVIILDNGVSSDLCLQYQEEISTLLQGKAEITAYIKNDATHMQAFSVRLTADDLDFVIAPETEMIEMAKNGYLLKYDESGVTSFYKSYPVESQLAVKVEGGQLVESFGVKLGPDSRYMTYRRNAGAGEDVLYLGVTIKKTNDENIVSSATYLLEDI